MNLTTVDEILTELGRAWTAGDSVTYANLFAEDADFVDALGRVQRGRDVIADEHQKIFDTIYKGSELTVWRVDSRELAEDVLLVHTRSTLRVPAGPRAGEWQAIQTKVFRDGKILAFHNTGLQGIAEFTDHDAALASRSPLEWNAQG